MVGPWLLLLVYDISFYAWRSVMHELPGFGGRARGEDRPRAPSLTERPSGTKRRFSLAGVQRASPERDDAATATSSKRGPPGAVARTIREVTEDEA